MRFFHTPRSPESVPVPPGETPKEDFRQRFHRLELELRAVYGQLEVFDGAKHLTLDLVFGNAYQPEPFDAKNAELVIPEMERVLALAKRELEALQHPTEH